MPRAVVSPALVSQLPLTYQQQIPRDYLDEMGHMNVMWYTYLFDQAGVEAFQLIGFDEASLRTHRSGAFALEAHIHYLSEVHAGQEVSVHTRILGRTEKRFHLMHFMLNRSKGDLAATFEAVAAHIGMETRRMSPLPTEIAKCMDAVLADHKSLDWQPPVCGTMGP